MRYALVENNRVKDIFVEPEGFSIEECFHPDIASLYIPCPDNIIKEDFYDSETQKFTENLNKKFPNHEDWFNSLRDKKINLNEYFHSLSPTINNLQMSYQRLDEYKTDLSFVLSGVDDMVEIDNQQFSGDDFKLMIDALKKFQQDKGVSLDNHLSNINSFNNASDIESYDFTTGWPGINISI